MSSRERVERGTAVLKAVSICFLSLFGIGSASACVSIQRSGHQYLIVNDCKYPIIAHYVSSTGETGVTGGILPGDMELTPVPMLYGLNVQWCNFNDWKARRCKLPQN